MTANIQQELNHIVELKSWANRLDNLIQGYRLCARIEGKSDKTIRITVTALNTLKDFLESKEYSTDVIDIGARELRGFIFHLQDDINNSSQAHQSQTHTICSSAL